MPGYILHLTAAKMFIKRLPPTDPLRSFPKLQNNFYIGNLLPDTVADKTKSHFRDPRFLDRMVVWPRPEEFRKKYAEHMQNPSYFGYYFHLCIDRIFFSEYLPTVAEFLDKNGLETGIMKEVRSVRLKKDGQLIPLEQYLSEDYYYGDYTRMSSWLYEQYRLPDRLYLNGCPQIEEIREPEIRKVFKQLEEYRRVPADAVRDLKVFDAGKLMAFLENSVKKLKKQS